MLRNTLNTKYIIAVKPIETIRIGIIFDFASLVSAVIKINRKINTDVAKPKKFNINGKRISVPNVITNRIMAFLVVHISSS